MNWNKKNPRFRRARLKNAVRTKKSRPRPSRQNLLSRFGLKIGGLLRGLTGKTAPPPAPEKTPPPRTAAAEDPFEDLKIALPKRRTYSLVCSPRTKPKDDAATEAGRKKAVDEVMADISASPAPEDLAAECEDMVDPLDLIEPEEPVELDEPVAAYEPVETPAAPPEEPESAPPRPESPEFLPKIAVVEQSAKSMVCTERRAPVPDGKAAVNGRRAKPSAAKGRKPQAEEAPPLREAGSAEAGGGVDPQARPQAASESDHIKNDGKKPTDWSRMAGKSRPAAPRRSKRPLGLIGLIALLGAGLALFFIYFPGQRTPVPKVARIPAANLPKIAPLAPGFYELYAREREAAVRSETTITPGSSLGKALEAVGIGARQGGPAIIETLTGEGGLNVVRPGAVVKSYWADRDRTELSYLEYYPASGDAPLVVRPKADGGFLRYSLATMPLTVSMLRDGEISSSLWEAGAKAGLDANVIMNITEILASEVDFFTDIKTGDGFQVLYSRDFSDGRPQGRPIIDMVKLTNKGRDLEYYRFENSEGQIGYYDPEGRSSVKTFFVTPLQYKRISSQFSMARKHPIFKTVRPHQGVDYAAPAGTPVSAVADGTVVFCGWSGGYGRLVTIKHNETYTTMYAHLSKFAPGLKKGSVVKQGDLIGNVGASGTATGPHLDFRLKKNNAFIDPIPELAKQQGKKIENKEDLQAFSTVVGQIRERVRQQAAARREE